MRYLLLFGLVLISCTCFSQPEIDPCEINPDSRLCQVQITNEYCVKHPDHPMCEERGLTSINDRISQRPLISPNPFHSSFVVDLKGTIHNSGVLIVYNSSGNILRNIKLDGSNTKIRVNIDSRSNSYYFVKIITDLGTWTQNLLSKK